MKLSNKEVCAILFTGLTLRSLSATLAKPNAPCMREGVCLKRYPRPFTNSTTVGSDGYPNYRRRDNGSTFVKENATMLMFCEVSEPRVLFDKFEMALAEDYLALTNGDAHLARTMLLWSLDAILVANNSSLDAFDSLPAIEDGIDASRPAQTPVGGDPLQRVIIAEDLRGKLNAEQERVYDAVLDAILRPSERESTCFFLDGPGGTGKTFVYKALIAQLRASQKVVVATASSGIASLLLEGGRTAHSVFKITIPIDATSTCAIEVESKHAK